MKPLAMAINDQVFSIEIFEEMISESAKAFLQILPFKMDLHYAKIAGDELYGIIPAFWPLEAGVDVGRIQPGTLAYFPSRQLLCLYYGPLQEEGVSITVLGRLTSDLGQVRLIGEEVRRQQGKTTFSAGFRRGEQTKPGKGVHLVSPIVDEYEVEIWETIPEEILQLKKLKGIMRPAGPLFYAEAESRTFHEWLYMTYQNSIEKQWGADLTRSILLPQLSALRSKMAGFYSLKRTARTLSAFEEALRDSRSMERVVTLCEHLAHFVGRINMWIDTLIPWNDVNEHLKGCA
jgi:hypothetical protein